MVSVLLQAGHSAEFPPNRTGGGGAPGEADWTARCARRLAAELAVYGIDVTIVGSWMSNGVVVTPPASVLRRYDLFIALHYDANIYGVGGGFIDRYRPENYGRPATGGRAVEERFMATFEANYFEETGIANKPNRRNPNTNDYYGYRSLINPTPRVLIEFGVGAPGAPDYDVLWNGLAEVTESTAACVAELFGIAPPPTPEPDPEDDMALLPKPPITREQAIADLQQAGFIVHEGFAIDERAILSGQRGEWRGPFIGDEYPYTHPDGRTTTRRDCTAGILDYDPSTNQANWAEVVKEARQ